MEERRQRLLIACGGFRAHDEHLKLFFNEPERDDMSECCPSTLVACVNERGFAFCIAGVFVFLQTKGLVVPLGLLRAAVVSA